jgi:AraC family transcriptional regulator, regulatory protein of adaptative response / methylated-DNA-[protein]-cysteine methyltransferase
VQLRITQPDKPLEMEIALDLRGSQFQNNVWRALQLIPAGETRTYQEIALSIGKPKACRAVAKACASNPLALIIPCHRVIRSDGSLGGYRWGILQKQQLLQREQTQVRQTVD